MNKSDRNVSNPTLVSEGSQAPKKPVLDLNPEPVEPGTLPGNRQATELLAAGYELVDGYRTRDREAAKDEAKRLRADGTKRTAYFTLTGGWFGVLTAPAKESAIRAAAAAKPTKTTPPMSFRGIEFGSTKEARAFARLLLDAARAAEFTADHDAAIAAKATEATEA